VRPRLADRLLGAGTAAAAAAAAAIVLLIAAFVLGESLPALREIGAARFFTDGGWHPTADGFNLAPMLLASLAVAVGATLLAAPVALLVALFCAACAPEWIANVVRRVVELLASIPSVVVGFFGLVALVPLIARLRPPGASLLAGVLVLALMILPTIALLAEASLRAVPRAQWVAAAALGIGRCGALRRVVIPGARRGLLGAIFLGLARALGETMAVLMVCGNDVRWPTDLFGPVRPLTANIALEMAYALGRHRSALFVSGLLLMAAVTVLVAASHARAAEPSRA